MVDLSMAMLNNQMVSIFIPFFDATNHVSEEIVYGPEENQRIFTI
jgi:hypothetical protein